MASKTSLNNAIRILRKKLLERHKPTSSAQVEKLSKELETTKWLETQLLKLQFRRSFGKEASDRISITATHDKSAWRYGEIAIHTPKLAKAHARHAKLSLKEITAFHKQRAALNKEIDNLEIELAFADLKEIGDKLNSILKKIESL